MPALRPRHLLFLLLAPWLAISSLFAQELKITHTGFNAGNQFVVEAEVPAGSRHAGWK
ncbi:MAG: hypothetical protein KA004_19510 [Verrucomicrobiales bacterium]|nr:hypothetical protein [Verrucomicrobiales bacterium]